MTDTHAGTKRRPFRSSERFYEGNIFDSRVARARPGIIERPDWREQPAVAVLAGKQVRLMLMPDDALRLANQIADVLGEINQSKEN